MINSISDCLDDTHSQRRAELVGCAIHRFSVPGCHDAAGVARYDRTDVNLGRRMAYHFVIDKAGNVEQALPLSVYGNHARGFNQDRFGIAVLGNFQIEAPTSAQLAALVELLAPFVAESPDFEIDRHDELGSYDPTKVCPGAFLNVEEVAREVDRYLAYRNLVYFESKGFVQ